MGQMERTWRKEYRENIWVLIVLMSFIVLGVEGCFALCLHVDTVTMALLPLFLFVGIVLGLMVCGALAAIMLIHEARVKIITAALEGK